ncbi:hypothetical protein IMCC3317_00350 [Kordia antarctica]|uniref:Uncharacterized protein n=1 Tax=Kordia antarctica TaxID=1218801 RepID=A0A7L4ZCP1_9FLAO|nr:hypothetical protein IMCC3317_00350 [Kordia antarctica]
MLQNIKNLVEVKTLTKKEQQTIHGGIHRCAMDGCPPGLVCTKSGCKEL